jgi:hypothetical protein
MNISGTGASASSASEEAEESHEPPAVSTSGAQSTPPSDHAETPELQDWAEFYSAYAKGRGPAQTPPAQGDHVSAKSSTRRTLNAPTLPSVHPDLDAVLKGGPDSEQARALLRKPSFLREDPPAGRSTSQHQQAAASGSGGTLRQSASSRFRSIFSRSNGKSSPAEAVSGSTTGNLGSPRSARPSLFNIFRRTPTGPSSEASSQPQHAGSQPPQIQPSSNSLSAQNRQDAGPEFLGQDPHPSATPKAIRRSATNRSSRSIFSRSGSVPSLHSGGKSSPAQDNQVEHGTPESLAEISQLQQGVFSAERPAEIRIRQTKTTTVERIVHSRPKK